MTNGKHSLAVDLALLVSLLGANSALADGERAKSASWRDLKEEAGMIDDVKYSQLKTGNGSKAELVVFDINGGKCLLKPAFNKSGRPTSDTAREHAALAAVNGGFFNLSNGESTSYVVVDGKSMCEPRQNKALTSNPKLAPYLETIFNRSEVRVLSNGKNKYKVRIMKHNDPVPKGWTLTDSLQAGPQLLPTMTEKEEAFVRKDPDGSTFDSIGAYKTAARTALGVTADGHVMLVCVAGGKQDEFSSGVTLKDLAALLQQLGCTEAINFDGGTSSTMVVLRQLDEQDATFEMVVGKSPETHVKSAMMILQRRHCGPKFGRF